ncbi:MAG: signal peptidase I [Verrucomicrobia bacterium]|nr:signal peptidase I [Verrucomicrobiota bacterium]MBU1735387.1 signal peptidase I [Verrucomicrobiota bacterium]MBU1857458.1 signal peptidase I [Verrucomicrobiota bacterium]
MKKTFAFYCKYIWDGWVREIIVMLAIMIPFRSSIADWYHVPTGSMKPSILECERVFVNKLAYDLKIPLTTWHLAEWGNPERGDIVVFYSPADQKRLVKRVIGLPGDVVEMRSNHLVINGQSAEYLPLDPRFVTDLSAEERTGETFAVERYGNLDHPVMAIPSLPAKRSFGPITIPENSYLMLGDNRDNSADSRFFGFVERGRIVGRTSTVVASFDPDNFYLPRWDRWFKRLP